MKSNDEDAGDNIYNLRPVAQRIVKNLNISGKTPMIEDTSDTTIKNIYMADLEVKVHSPREELYSEFSLNIIINKDQATQTGVQNSGKKENVSFILKDKEKIQHLHEEIIYLHAELTNKNDIITSLLNILKSFQNGKTELIETSPKLVCGLTDNNTSELDTNCSPGNSTVISGKDYFSNVNDTFGTHGIQTSTLSINSSDYDSDNEETNSSKIFRNINETIMTNNSNICESYDDQISNYRINHRNKYFKSKSINVNNDIMEEITSNKLLSNFTTNAEINYDNESTENNNIDKNSDNKFNRFTNDIKVWPENTVLITGSSILNGIEENRLSKTRNVKVRAFSGAYVDDMYDYLLPLLKKKPSYIFLHIGSNDAPHKTGKDIFNEILGLKSFILFMLPTVTIYLSCPVLRLDDARANLALRHLSFEMKSLPNIIVNDKVDGSCLGKKGLHLNAKGSGRLAINFISLIRRL